MSKAVNLLRLFMLGAWLLILILADLYNIYGSVLQLLKAYGFPASAYWEDVVVLVRSLVNITLYVCLMYGRKKALAALLVVSLLWTLWNYRFYHDILLSALFGMSAYCITLLIYYGLRYRRVFEQEAGKQGVGSGAYEQSCGVASKKAMGGKLNSHLLRAYTLLVVALLIFTVSAAGRTFYRESRTRINVQGVWKGLSSVGIPGETIFTQRGARVTGASIAGNETGKLVGAVIKDRIMFTTLWMPSYTFDYTEGVVKGAEIEATSVMTNRDNEVLRYSIALEKVSEW